MQHHDEKNLEIILKALSKVVIARRKQLDKSQRMLAFEYGLHKSLINRIENATSEIKILSLFKIAKTLGIKTSELLSEVEKELPKNFEVLD